MPVIALEKKHEHLIAETKKALSELIISEGKNPKDYDYRYIYDEMSRKPYSSGYKEAHNKASLDWYYRNKATGNPIGRPKKERKD